MNAMIFAAGLGTRLKPLTDTMPKALVPVANRPLLQYVLDKLRRAGASDIVVNVHHFADQIKAYLLDTDVKISDESSMLLDTGGGLKKAQSLFDNEDPILIHNVDILSNLDLKKFYDTAKENEATLVVSWRETKRYLIFDESMRLVGWTNIETGEVKSPVPEVHQAFNRDYVATGVAYSFADLVPKPTQYKLLAFAGIHQISSSLLSEMDHWPEKFSIIDFYLEQCATHIIKGYVQENLKLMDVGKLNILKEAEEFIKTI